MADFSSVSLVRLELTCFSCAVCCLFDVFVPPCPQMTHSHLAQCSSFYRQKLALMPSKRVDRWEEALAPDFPRGWEGISAAATMHPSEGPKDNKPLVLRLELAAWNVAYPFLRRSTSTLTACSHPRYDWVWFRDLKISPTRVLVLLLVLEIPE
eukprot:3299020-Rhodomonas_salina.2